MWKVSFGELVVGGYLVVGNSVGSLAGSVGLGGLVV